MAVKPITPNEVASQQEKLLPDFVIEVWNNIIAESAGSSESFNIRVGVAARRLKDRAQQEMVYYDSKWLDIEQIYRKYGWKVHYDAPAYNETYEGFYTFSPIETKTYG